MATLYNLQESNIRKTYLYLFLFSILFVFVGWFLSYYFDNVFVLYFAIAYSLFSSFFSYWFSDRIVLLITRARPIEKKDHSELYRLVENLCITAGLPLPKIYIINDPSPNAFATGRDPKHSVVVFTTGLLEKLERAELEGVVAHELSHIKNRDTLLATVVTVLVGTIVFITDIFIRRGIRIKTDKERRSGGVVLFLIGLLVFLLAALFAQLMRFAISRKREFLADASGALLTRYPEGLARALEKISNYPYPLRVANNATAHLFIINPFKNKNQGGILMRLFSTHPPVEERIKALRKMAI